MLIEFGCKGTKIYPKNGASIALFFEIFIWMGIRGGGQAALVAAVFIACEIFPSPKQLKKGFFI